MQSRERGREDTGGNNGQKFPKFRKIHKSTYSRSSANFKSVNAKRFTERHITIKLSKTKGKRELETSKGQATHHSYKGSSIILTQTM